MTQQIHDQTPLMKQYHAIKERHKDALLLFQVGDFYELFFDDAKRAAACLGIALTKRGKHNGEPIPLCGVPVHTLDFYLTKLIRAGFNVALCDQLEEPKPGKVVDRGVTQVLTPGTLTDPKLLDAHSASYLLSFFPHENQWGLVFGELLTSQLFATVLPAPSEKLLETELVRFFPDEVVLPATTHGKEFQAYFKRAGYVTSYVTRDDTRIQGAHTWMGRFGDRVYEHDALTQAIINFHFYMQATHEHALDTFTQLSLYQPDDFLILDAATQKNLELVKNSYDGTRTHTLLQVMDGSVTPMGSRMIKKWVMRPLVDHAGIEQRLDVVQAYAQDIAGLHVLEKLFKALGDCERIIGRIAVRRATVHDYRALIAALEVIPVIITHLHTHAHLRLLQAIRSQIQDFAALKEYMRAALHDDPAHEWLIKKGFDQRLDEMRDLVESGVQAVLALESTEQHATGIGSLKIRYNQIHGYYIEVTKTHMDAIPERYIRRQTLVGRERYTTPELEQLEHKLQCAQRDIKQVEHELFERVKQEVSAHISGLRKMAHALAHADALIGLARVAYEHRYVRPTITPHGALSIRQGRHPVIERTLLYTGQTPFIANDTLITDEQRLWIITGPNMGGKSTYLRHVALIAIMAHIGSFVPADAATVPLFDRVFTRIGAGDNLAHGKSTFLVEMEETATICSQATRNSLVILDEVGRGTSTFDGLALAQAIVEYVYTTLKAKCLFATHYHELTALSQEFPGIESYYAASKKSPHGIVFLYTMIKGVADGSFGIEVAKMAQVPPSVINRAQEIVDSLSAQELMATPVSRVKPASLLDEATEIAALHEQIRMLKNKLANQAERDRLIGSIDYDQLSPRAAFDLLWRLKEGK